MLPLHERARLYFYHAWFWRGNTHWFCKHKELLCCVKELSCLGRHVDAKWGATPEIKVPNADEVSLIKNKAQNRLASRSKMAASRKAQHCCEMSGAWTEERLTRQNTSGSTAVPDGRKRPNRRRSEATSVCCIVGKLHFKKKKKNLILHLVNSECTGKKDYGGFGHADEETSAWWRVWSALWRV